MPLPRCSLFWEAPRSVRALQFILTGALRTFISVTLSEDAMTRLITMSTEDEDEDVRSELVDFLSISLDNDGACRP